MGFDRSRRVGRAGSLGSRRTGRLWMIVVAVFTSDVRPVVFGFCGNRRMVAVLQTGSDSHRCRGSDHGADAEEHHRVCKGWYRFCLAASMPHPAGSHHDVDLEQQYAEVGGSYQLGFSGVRAERRSRGPRQRPERDGSYIARDPRGEHRRTRPNQHRSRPNQLAQCDCDEEQP